MLTNSQRAETVIAAMQENCPQVLARAAADGTLAKILQDRLEAYSLQVARMTAGVPPNHHADLEESCLPMLTEFPKSKARTPLTPLQEQMVERAVDAFLDQELKASEPTPAEPIYD